MFWLPFITVTASILGGALESLLNGDASLLSWLARLAAPATIGAAWFAVTIGMTSSGRGWTDWLIYSGFAVPAWVGMWAVHMARSERGE